MNIHEAETPLPRLIEKVLAGEEVVIAKPGTAVVRLAPVEKTKPVLVSGAGMVRMTPGWGEPMTEREVAELLGE